MSKKLYVVLRFGHQRLPGHSIAIEGEHSLGVQSHTDFATRFRDFLDRIENHKYLGNIEFLQTAELDDREKERLTYFAHVAHHIAKEIRFSFGTYEDSLVGISNIFDNLPFLLEQPDLSQLEVKGQSSAVVVSAGPSLEEALPLLRTYQDRLLIVCVDASYKRLIEEKIIPDFVTTTERYEYSLPFLEKADPSKRSRLVAYPLVPRKLISSFQGPHISTLKMTGPCMWLPFRRPIMWSGSSSAHLAYRICQTLKAQRICLVGQDLAYHPETFQSHADLKAYPEWSEEQKKEELIQKEKAFEVEGNTYEKVLSNSVWDLFSREFRSLHREIQIPTCNSSRLGRKIQGIDYVEFEDWIKASEGSSKPKIQVPERNPFYDRDKVAVLSKTEQALSACKNLRHDIDRSLRLNHLAEIYKRILKTPHFLELVFELVIQDYATCESTSFATPEKTDECRKAYLEQVVVATDQISEKLEGALKYLRDADSK